MTTAAAGLVLLIVVDGTRASGITHARTIATTMNDPYADWVE